MRDVFAPGCALLIYKPELAARVRELLSLPEHRTCCRHEPGLERGTRVVNICPGCDRRYRELYDGVSTISLWELLAERELFTLPDYGGARMTIADACPTRDQARVHVAVRTLIERMNIELVEPEHTGANALCCGDTYFGKRPVSEVEEKMRRRAAQMPANDVVVYCVSCIKSMHIGGRRPRYLVDLLFGEATHPGTFEPEAWHAELDTFIAAH